MEQEIRTSLPNGNPLVAYGTAPRWNPRRIAAIAAGALVLLILAPAITYLFVGRIPFPEHAAVTASVRASSGFQESLPGIWGRAARTGAFPALLGLSMRDGRPEPFVVTPRWSDIPSSHVRRSGPFAIWSDAPISAWSERRPWDLVRPFIRLTRNETFISVDLDELAPGIGTGSVSGPFASGVWTTEAVLPTRDANPLPPGDLGIDIASFPDAWPAIRSALAENGITAPIDSTPTAMGWTVTTGTIPEIRLRFENGVSTATVLAFASAAGVFDVVQVKLPDDEVVEELRPPSGRVSSGSPIRWEVASGTWLVVSGTELSLQRAPMPETDTDRVCSDGRPVVRLSPKAVDLLLQQFGIPERNFFKNVEISEASGKMIVCLQ